MSDTLNNQSNPPSLRDAAQSLMKSEALERSKEKSILNGLGFLAQTLNAESDDLNSTIQTINEKLHTWNFGVEVWCNGSDESEYGFDRVGDKWQLAVRSESFTRDGQRYSRPLLSGTRNERIEGLELVPEILRRLKTEAERKVNVIRKAKEFAASL